LMYRCISTEYRKNLHVPYLLSNVYNMVPWYFLV
jgi:hypothetical protein